jgi:hypothetical protein
MEKAANLFPVEVAQAGNGGIQGAGHEAAGGEAMPCRKSEISHR